METPRPTRFTIRVYGLLLQDGRVLVAEETYQGRRMHKFPGGGLEPGEGTLEAVIREFKEETGLDIVVQAHFYTTDFFVVSAFDPQVQVISIYYLVQTSQTWVPSPKELDESLARDAVFKWKEVSTLDPQTYFTFPIDQHVCGLLQQTFSDLV